MPGVRDRFDDMQARRKELPASEKKKKSMNSGGNEDVQGFLQRVEGIEGQLKTIKDKTRQMKKLQQDILSSPFCDKKQVLRYEDLIEEIRQESSKVRSFLRNTEDDIAKSKNSGTDTALERVCLQQVNRLTTELSKCTNEFFTVQADYMDKMKKRVKTQLSVTRGSTNLSEEEINKILQDDSYSVFTQNYISEAQDAESQLKDIETRHKDILALEKNVLEVNQLFKDVYTLVENQGTTLDSIEANIITTGDHVEAGTGQLKKAKEYRKKARRRKFCIAAIIIIVLAIIIAIILAVTLK